mmetsp:Transcript_29622/g.50007  ORF Transcript_29622/g.50007 Transcript_29622/m.50007 type:complete len:202 (+) Transcript_29622:40-645(+)|eukprot:CAMPEP_0114428394 /NCGR_PEP_ID=MMETSP0103-20121206/8900_1 /TAXON_ID=37642 ORGANISM="Paraphysomonas imperforata, Strain PA2" /NCGR_SAMPLE_ID=MMETSP0103 /ASSEMBLY_ACC=CAM_ASM_000201 /LENGTH=201 /DNA_ID=CAMNT_0001597603 /DNA_START=34 /DNA_END=639 /DNA_ORIENTATION=-
MAEFTEAPVSATITTTTGPKLAPFNPTSVECVHLALDMLQVQEEDVLYDLGCGDGRLLIEASKKYGISGVGIEYDSALCDKARAKVEEEGVGDKVNIVHANVLDVDISPATIIFIYLVPEGMRAMREALVSAIEDRAVRVVTYVFSIPEQPPVEVQLYKNIMKLYLYKIQEETVIETDKTTTDETSSGADQLSPATDSKQC